MTCRIPKQTSLLQFTQPVASSSQENAPPPMSILSLSPEISLHIAGFLPASDITSLTLAIPPLSRLLTTSYPWRFRWHAFKADSHQLFWQIQDAQRHSFLQLSEHMYNNGINRSSTAYDKSLEFESKIRERLKEMGFGDSQRVTPDDAFCALHHVFQSKSLRMRSIMGDSEHISDVASSALKCALEKIASLELVTKFIPELSPAWTGSSQDYALLTAYLFHTSLSPSGIREHLRLSHSVFIDDPCLIEYFSFLALFLRLCIFEGVLRPESLRPEQGPTTTATSALSFQAVIMLESRLDQCLESFFAISLHRPKFKSTAPEWKMSSQGSQRGQLTLSSTVKHSSQGPPPTDTLTAEQQLLVDCDVRKGELFKVRAYAGTGKTRCLIEYAAVRPRVKMLYLAYNKSAQIDAEIRFQRCRNVTAKTIHSLARGALNLTNKRAYRNLQAAKDDYIEPRIAPEKIVELLDLGKIAPSCFAQRPGEKWKDIYTLQVARLVIVTLERYTGSSEEQPTESHLPMKLIRAKGILANRILDLSRKAWSLILSARSVSITHDMYLKFMALNSEGDSVFSEYSVILFDEAQDATSCMAQIVLRQSSRCGILVVGDPYQQIYQFRGANNECFDDKLNPPARTFHLTTSFRFGTEIASVANCLLRNVRELVPVNGARKKRENSEGVYRLGRCGLFPENSDRAGSGLQFAMIFRKNSTMVKFCLRNAMKNVRFFFKGNTINHSSRVFPLLRDAYELFHFRKPSRLKGLKGFKSWEEAKAYYEGNSDDSADLQSDERVSSLAIVLPLESMIADQENNFMVILDACQRNISGKEAEADIIMSTVHQSKGLEYDNVVVANDFDISPDDAEAACFGFHRRKEIMDLLYVACTRAKLRLFVSATVEQFLCQEFGLYRLFLSPIQDPTLCPVCKGFPQPTLDAEPGSRPHPQILVGYESILPVAFEQSAELPPLGSPTFPCQLPQTSRQEQVFCTACALNWKSRDHHNADREMVNFSEFVKRTMLGIKPQSSSSNTTLFVHNKIMYPETLRTAMADCLSRFADRKCELAARWTYSKSWSRLAYAEALREAEEALYDDDDIDEFIGSADY